MDNSVFGYFSLNIRTKTDSGYHASFAVEAETSRTEANKYWNVTLRKLHTQSIPHCSCFDRYAAT